MVLIVDWRRVREQVEAPGQGKPKISPVTSMEGTDRCANLLLVKASTLRLT
jgi:hypothetical protein